MDQNPIEGSQRSATCGGNPVPYVSRHGRPSQEAWSADPERGGSSAVFRLYIAFHEDRETDANADLLARTCAAAGRTDSH
jgi:hypothetical protein